MPTTAGAPPGSGANFAALKGKLAARGAHDPGALAAWIGRKKYGKKAFGAMSHHHGNTYPYGSLDFAGGSMRCPNCGHTGEMAEFGTDSSRDNGSGPAGTAGASVGATPQPDDNQGLAGFSPQHFQVRSSGSGGGIRMSNGRRGVELARRAPVKGFDDVVISRVPGRGAIVRHRMGGTEIGELTLNDDGTYRATVDGRNLAPHRVQRAALQEMLSVYNTGTASPERPVMPLQRPAPQPDMFAALGISNVRAFASDPDDDGDDDDSPEGDTDKDFAGGLSPRGAAIFKKLRAKGVSPKVALAMAKRAEATKPGSFGRG